MFCIIWHLGGSRRVQRSVGMICQHLFWDFISGKCVFVEIIFLLLFLVEAISCMVRSTCYQTDHMDLWKILGFLREISFCWQHVTNKCSGWIFKLMYRWLVSLWLNHHCVVFLDVFSMNSVLSLWLPLGRLWAPFGGPLGSMWGGLGCLGTSSGLYWKLNIKYSQMC